MRNPFRYFNSSPEVIRLTVMMYVRYRSRCGRLKICCSNAGSISPRNGAALVEPIWSDVRRGDPQAARSPSIVLELALAPG
jgi:hypothetical protein